MKKSAVWFPVILLIYGAVSLVLSFPVPLRLTTFLPGGLGDPPLNLWILGWNFLHFHNLDFSTYWNGNFHYPCDNATAYSDPLIGIALAAYPFHVLTHDLIATHNLFFLFTFVASAFSVFLLSRHLTGDCFAAFIGGLIFAFSPYRFSQTGHIQVLAAMWLPLIFLAMHLALERSRLPYYLMFLLLILLNALTSGYLGIYLNVFILLFLILIPGTRKAPFVIGISICMLICLGILWPLYHHITSISGYCCCSLETLRSLSPDLHSFFKVIPQNLIYGKLLGRSFARVWQEKLLFPGLVPVLLTASYLILIRGKGGRIPLFYLGMIFLGLIFALGPFIDICGVRLPAPYSLLYSFAPGFKSLRFPGRMMIFALLGMSIISSYLLARISLEASRLKKSLFFGALAFLIILEGCSLPLPGLRLPGAASLPFPYKWLADAPPGPVAEYPLADCQSDGDSIYMYYSTFHWKPLVNGYSRVLPPGRESLNKTLQKFPAPVALDTLSSIGVRYILVHLGQYREDAREEMILRLNDLEGVSIRRVYSDGLDIIYEMPRKNP